jgi:predicted Zn-dependent peptidase
LVRYQNVTREDIQRVAQQYLVKDNRVVLKYLPKSEEPQATNAQ